MSRLLFVVARPVWPTTGGGQLRSAGLIDIALDAGHEVLLVQPAGGAKVPSRAGLRCVEIDLRRGAYGYLSKLCSRRPLRSPRPSRRGNRAAAKAVRDFDGDIAVLGEVHAVTLWHLVPEGMPLVYDSPNVEVALYAELVRAAGNALDKVTLRIDRRRIGRAERQLLAAANAVTAVSPQDLAALEMIVPVRRSEVVPSSVPTPTSTADVSGSTQLLFIGSLDYPPNAAAVEELVERIVPAVRREVPGATLLVAGRRASARLRRLLDRDGCLLRDDVDDVSEVYLTSRCMALPIRSGSGTRLKVYECLAHGLPLVATPRAVEGVPLVAGKHYLQAESSEDLVAAVVQVLTYGATADQLSRAGRSHFADALAWRRVAEPFTALVTELVPAERALRTGSAPAASRDRPRRFRR